jgi:Beta-galactosidase
MPRSKPLAVTAAFLFLPCLSHATTVTVEWVRADALSAKGAPGVRDAGPTTQSGSATVSTKGVPALFKNGTFSVPVQMMAPFSTDQKAAARGLEHSQCVGCQLMAWPRGFDPIALNTILTNELAGNPNALIVLRVGLNPGNWWQNAHPNDMIVSSGGVVSDFVSPSSMAWDADCRKRLADMVKFIESRPYSDHVIGYHWAAYSGGEWNLAGSTRFEDYSPANLAAFQSWARAKYHNDIKALKAAWNDSAITSFNQITIPTPASRQAADLGPLFNPALRGEVIDYYDFWSNQVANRIESCAGAVKAASLRKPLVGVFYGYLFETQQKVEMGHAALHRLTQSPHLDYLSAPYSYVLRCRLWGSVDGPGEQNGAGAFHGPVDSVLLNGKLFWNEDDTRTDLCRTPRNKTVCIGRARTLAVLRRNFAAVLTRGAGLWRFDLYGENWFNADDIMDEISLERQKYQSVASDPAFFRKFAPEVVFIVDEKSARYVARDKSSANLMALDMFLREDVQRSGTSVGYYLIEDLVEGRVPDAKVYVFGETFHLNRAERDWINANLKRANKTLIWLYGAGLIDDTSINIQNMRDLTGLNLVLGAQPPSDITPTALALGCNSQLGNVGLKWAHVANKTLRSRGPRIIYGAAGEGQVFGTDRLLGKPTIISKDMGTWTSVYVGALDLPKEWCRTLFSRGGAHMYLRDNCYEPLHVGRAGIVCVYPTATMRTTLYFKEASNVYDLMTGAQVQTNVDRMPVVAFPYTNTFVFKVQPTGNKWIPSGTSQRSP